MFLRTRTLLRAGQLPAPLRSAGARLQNTRLPAIACSTTTRPARQFSSARHLQNKSEAEIDTFVRDIKGTWGEYLPEGLLSPQEFAVYERYFGAPLRMLKEGESPEDFLDHDAPDSEALKPLEAGTMTLEDAEGKQIDIYEEVEEAVESHIKADSNLTPQEIRAYEQLSRDISNAYIQKNGDEDMEKTLENDFEADEYGDEEGSGMPGSYIRAHPLTKMGRFSTFPSTVEPPESLVLATGAFLSKVSNKHLDQSAHKVYGEHLEKSPISTTKKRNNSAEFRIHPSQPMVSDLEADVHFATVMPGLHAQALSTLAELRRRLGRDWVLNDVKRVLDVGTGGAGVVAWQSVIDAEIEANGPINSQDRKEKEEADPETNGTFKGTVIVASPTLRYRSAQFLENTTFLPRLPDFHPSNPKTSINTDKQTLQPRKYYDLVIATNTILPLNEDYKRKYHVENLWSLVNPNGGVLLMIEKGTPSGFEVIAGARHHLLKNRVSSPNSETRDDEPLPANANLDDPTNPLVAKEKGQIIAPCTNHEECPLYLHGPGVKGRKDFCHFKQKYIRPYYMQRVIKATGINHENLTYSYVAFRRGKDTRSDSTAVVDPQLEDFDTSVEPHTSPFTEEELRKHFHTLPRVIFEPFKRHKHVIIDVCAPSAKIERWTVPASFGKLVYHDARKSQWGDLWALGAKTKILRNISPGTPKKMGGGGKPEKLNLDKEGSGRSMDKVQRRVHKNNWKQIWLETKKSKAKQARADKAAMGNPVENAWRKERAEKFQKEKKESSDFSEDY
ncbi:mitochondrial small ribosomal subunit Rsm22-domain-containing protein [Peziza echinospora]|nr:mitochondrial small ribosomal subunit Rsm22-domain-containing protein [Peziza echinospora]